MGKDRKFGLKWLISLQAPTISFDNYLPRNISHGTITIILNALFQQNFTHTNIFFFLFFIYFVCVSCISQCASITLLLKILTNFPWIYYQTFSPFFLISSVWLSKRVSDTPINKAKVNCVVIQKKIWVFFFAQFGLQWKYI